MQSCSYNLVKALMRKNQLILAGNGATRAKAQLKLRQALPHIMMCHENHDTSSTFIMFNKPATWHALWCSIQMTGHVTCIAQTPSSIKSWLCHVCASFCQRHLGHVHYLLWYAVSRSSTIQANISQWWVSAGVLFSLWLGAFPMTMTWCLPHDNAPTKGGYYLSSATLLRSWLSSHDSWSEENVWFVVQDHPDQVKQRFSLTKVFWGFCTYEVASRQRISGARLWVFLSACELWVFRFT